MWTKANWDLIRSEVSKFKEKFLSEYTSRSVEDNYNEVSKCLESVIDQHVSSKISTSKSNTPWFNPTLKRMCRKKQRLFSCAKKSHKKAHWDKYLNPINGTLSKPSGGVVGIIYMRYSILASMIITQNHSGSI